MKSSLVLLGAVASLLLVSCGRKNSVQDEVVPEPFKVTEVPVTTDPVIVTGVYFVNHATRRTAITLVNLKGELDGLYHSSFEFDGYLPQITAGRQGKVSYLFREIGPHPDNRHYVYQLCLSPDAERKELCVDK